VDAFAGPGKFDDGQPGSPRIICNNVNNAIERGLPVPVSVICIEQDAGLSETLKKSLTPYSFAVSRQGRFTDFIDEIEKSAQTHSVFLYLDPFTVEGLVWNKLDRIFCQLQQARTSIEVLMNFNSSSFARRGLAALKLAIPNIDTDHEDAEQIDGPFVMHPTIDHLVNVAGGNWWIDVLSSDKSFSTKVQELTDGICGQLRARFNEVCQHGVKALPHHTIPKYYLIFASRHPEALRLMNDEMVKSRQTLAAMAKPEEETLFEMRSTDLVPDRGELPSLILKHAKNPMPRKHVILNVIREKFCHFAYKDIRGEIERMLRSGTIRSETGKVRINDNVRIWRT
jgi:hypothetical protein